MTNAWNIIDADLTAGNIKSGVNIFWVAGSYTGDNTETTGTTNDGSIDIDWNRRGTKFYYNITSHQSWADYCIRSDAATLARLAVIFGTISTSTKFAWLDNSGTTTMNQYNGSAWTQGNSNGENNILTSFTLA